MPATQRSSGSLYSANGPIFYSVNSFNRNIFEMSEEYCHTSDCTSSQPFSATIVKRQK